MCRVAASGPSRLGELTLNLDFTHRECGWKKGWAWLQKLAWHYGPGYLQLIHESAILLPGYSPMTASQVHLSPWQAMWEELPEQTVTTQSSPWWQRSAITLTVKCKKSVELWCRKNNVGRTINLCRTNKYKANLL